MGVEVGLTTRTRPKACWKKEGMSKICIIALIYIAAKEMCLVSSPQYNTTYEGMGYLGVVRLNDEAWNALQTANYYIIRFKILDN